MNKETEKKLRELSHRMEKHYFTSQEIFNLLEKAFYNGYTEGNAAAMAEKLKGEHTGSYNPYADVNHPPLKTDAQH